MKKVILAVSTGLAVALCLLAISSFTVHSELFNFDFSVVEAHGRFLIASLTLTSSVGSAVLVAASSVGEKK
jgi:hypothetical protein